MAEFFDHLWEQFHASPSQQQRSRYREYLKSLIGEGPPLRLLELERHRSLGRAAILQNLPSTLPFPASLQAFDLFLLELAGDSLSPSSFRQAKQLEAKRPFWRRDPLHDEIAVLETLAMGADAYFLAMSELDQAGAQFLVELGRDYGLPAILCCRSEEELATGLLMRDVHFLCLEGVLLAPQLLELEHMRQKTILFDLRDFEEAPLIPSGAKSQVILIEHESLSFK